METIRFITSLSTFYLKGEIKHEQNFIKLKKPNTILTFIPLGSQKKSIPVNQISSVGTSFHLIFSDLVIGFALAVLGIMLFGQAFLIGCIMLLIGASMVINSFQTTLVLNLTSGEEMYVFFLIFEKGKADLAEQQINMLISNRLDDTNTRVHTENQTSMLVDAIKNNR